VASGDADEACAEYDRARGFLDARAHANACLWAHLRRARAHDAAGRRAEAAADAVEAERFAMQVNAAAAAHLARVLGAALRGDCPPALLAEREAVAARLSPLEAAYADHDLARAGAGPAFRARARARLEAVASTLAGDARRAFLEDVAFHREIVASAR
jgi:hypothetical protein